MDVCCVANDNTGDDRKKILLIKRKILLNSGLSQSC